MELLIFICLVVLFLAALMNDKLRRKKKWIKAVPYTVLVRETLHYMNDIFAENNIAYYPKIHILYREHKRFKGYYHNEEIFIYIKSNESDLDIVRTTLHEGAHFLDFKRDPQRFNKYNKNYDFNRFAQFMSYYGSPLEIFAREYSEENLDKCLKFLKKKGIIVFK